MNVQPDLEFIKSLKLAGGDTLKKCYQCATCSVACPLSTDDKPFPRKEMIWSQWGMKENLVADPDVFLCHACGDCTEMCPRGAKPGEVLGAIRSYAYTFYGWPSGLAKLATSAKNLPVLIGIPSIIILVLWFLSGAMHVPSVEHFASHGYQQFFGTWDFRWYAKNIFFIVLFMVPAAGLAVFSVFMGITKMWKEMTKRAGIKSAFRPSIVQFFQMFLWPTLVETMQHNRFRECTVNTDRVKGHLPLVLAFIGLFIVTCWSLLKNDVLGLFWTSLHGPLPLIDPFKILANVSAIALLYGIWILWSNRKDLEAKGRATPTFYDWFLIWEILAVGVTGVGAELLRWAGLPIFGYIVYFMHLVAVMMLFLYMPYTKFAHIVYRTTAMCFEKYRESGFAKQ
ncbi:quinone-interacting membrane-bound oxidoreductase complex subunit QmoC [Desulfosediminicola flagellatus]|uniref:quinone-interacting membrane-bound oxidoreductase complex subunit QmoC n=1 Tax=Desulfosediminicola flagellatus TaxID=2569541 RepID=UPI0010AC82C2|nr:quinone-interacting membrane-bound oxidoreductase complex subunit QmoC [Desulfosediminicola flagellatus]